MISPTHHQLSPMGISNDAKLYRIQGRTLGCDSQPTNSPSLQGPYGANSNRDLSQHIPPISQYWHFLDEAVQAVKNTTISILQTVHFHLSQRDFKRGSVKSIAEILSPSLWSPWWVTLPMKGKGRGSLITALLFMYSNYDKAITVQIERQDKTNKGRWVYL